MCRIDDLTVEGTGFNKKEAKSLAVKKALVEWKKSLLKKLDVSNFILINIYI